jgi:nucleotide-binding universal stress UspA family protein
MNNIKRIVVGVDFSVYSPRVLKYAAESAERMSAEIVAVNVINQRRIRDTITVLRDEKVRKQIMESYVNDETEKRKIKMNSLINSWVPKDVSYRNIIKTGMPFEEILKVVDDEDATLLIISSRGRTNFQDYMFGTTAEKLFRYSPVSVLSLNLKDE